VRFLCHMAGLVNVLFVCVGNCVRSQMAEALARHCASDIIDPESAGIRPLGFIDPTARSVLESRGISMNGQFSKGLHIHLVQKADLIINMSGMPAETLFHGHVFEEWRVPDPFGDDVETHRRSCDDIEARVKDLAERLRAARDNESAGTSFGSESDSPQRR
jgi:arsenate reductase (thioredoxin)